MMTDRTQIEESLRRLNHIRNALAGSVNHLRALPDDQAREALKGPIANALGPVELQRMRLIEQLHALQD